MLDILNYGAFWNWSLNFRFFNFTIYTYGAFEAGARTLKVMIFLPNLTTAYFVIWQSIMLIDVILYYKNTKFQKNEVNKIRTFKIWLPISKWATV